MNELNSDELRVRVRREDMWNISGAPDLEITSFRFKPKAFVIENSRLEERIIEASVQVQSLERFRMNPRASMTYICAGNPDDVKARTFAAYLAVIHKNWMVDQGRQPQVIWERVYGGFENPAMRASVDPTLLVIDNLSSIPNKVKYDKVRDLIARWAHIPKVLVVAGEDPISFAAARIYKPVHGMAYFPSKISKIATQII